MRGRKPIPIPIKRARGNPGKRRVGEEPQVRRIRPEIGKGLDARAKKFLDELLPELERVGGVTVLDGPALFLMADSYSEVLELRALIKKVGRNRAVILGYQAAFRKAVDNCRKWLMEYGGTWLSRTRLAMKEIESPEDEAGLDRIGSA